MVRNICGRKVVDRKMTKQQMEMLELRKILDGWATTNEVKCYGHWVRRDDNSLLRIALDLKTSGKKTREGPKKTWKKQVKEETEKIGLRKEDALNSSKCRDGVRTIAEKIGWIHSYDFTIEKFFIQIYCYEAPKFIQTFVALRSFQFELLVFETILKVFA